MHLAIYPTDLYQVFDHSCLWKSIDWLDLMYKPFQFKNNLQGDFGHFRENNLIILSKVAKIALECVLN